MSRTWQLATLVALAGAGCLVTAVAAQGAGNLLALAALASSGAAFELAGPRIVPGGRFSASYLAILVAGVISGAGAAAVVAVSTVAVSHLVRRRPLTRLAFNSGSLAVAGVAAGVIVGRASDQSVGAFAALAAVAVLCNYAVTSGLVVTMVAVDRGRTAAAHIARAAARLIPGYVVLGTAAVVLAELSLTDPWTWPTLCGLAVAAAISLRQLAAFAAQPAASPTLAQPARAA